MSIFYIDDWLLSICSGEQVGNDDKQATHWIPGEISVDWWIIDKKMNAMVSAP
jgi:hypothetical protein